LLLKNVSFAENIKIIRGKMPQGGRRFVYNFLIEHALAILIVQKRVVNSCTVIGRDEHVHAKAD